MSPGSAWTADAWGNETIDFGFYRLTLGDQVWLDANNDGLLNNSETGIPSVLVVLYDAQNTPVPTTTTDASGLYTFTSLMSGTYDAGIVVPPGYASSTDIGTSGNPDNDTNSDDNGVTLMANEARSNPITLTPGSEPIVLMASGTTSNPTLDFGVYPLVPGIDLVKYTNGYDADAVTGPFIPVGSAVTWTYVVRRTPETQR